MRASRLSVVARGWLEMKGLDHLLPDPHTHEQIQGCIATYYPGGCVAFLKDVDGLLDFHEPVPSPPLRPRPAAVPEQLPLPIETVTAETPDDSSDVSQPTWFNPPKVPVSRVCERDHCEAVFETTKAYGRFCSIECREGWVPVEEMTVDQLLGRAA